MQKEIDYKLLKDSKLLSIYESSLKKIENYKKTSFKLDQESFNAEIKSKYEKATLENDGYSINGLNLGVKNFSDGQRISFALKLFLNSFAKKDKYVFLDDVFEKMDIENIVDTISNIFDILDNKESKINIVVLTHDITLLKILNLVIKNTNKQYLIDKNKIVFSKMNDFKNIQKFFLNNSKIEEESFINLITNEKQMLFFDFESFLDFINQKFRKNKNLNEITKLFSFCKLFYRSYVFYNNRQVNVTKNLISDLKNLNEEILDLDINDFISACVFHYEDNIKDYLEKHKGIGLLNLKLKNVSNTVELYNKVIEDLECFSNSEKENELKNEINKIVKYLKFMLEFIKKEKEYYKNNCESFDNTKSKKHFYDGMYESKTVADQEKMNKIKRIRNKIFESYKSETHHFSESHFLNCPL